MEGIIRRENGEQACIMIIVEYQNQRRRRGVENSKNVRKSGGVSER